MKTELANYLNAETEKLKLKQRREQVAQTIIANYPGGVCPDCGWKVRKDVVDCEGCRNCGHVFYLPEL